MMKAIEIRNLTYHYPDGTPALQDINLDIAEGESVGIVGPNGAGKSTLLLHLNGILEGEGSIKVLGLEVNKNNLPEIRSKVGLVFQDPDSQLFMPTVFDDVAFGPINMRLTRNEVMARVDSALEQIGMPEFSSRTSHHLSLGEKRKVSLATVLSMDLEILALDEPTSNLDPASRRNFIDFIKEMKLTKIIATHDLDLVREAADRVIVLEGGRIQVFA